MNDTLNLMLDAGCWILDARYRMLDNSTYRSQAISDFLDYVKFPVSNF